MRENGDKQEARKGGEARKETIIESEEK